jgi:hypothetical protein
MVGWQTIGIKYGLPVTFFSSGEGDVRQVRRCPKQAMCARARLPMSIDGAHVAAQLLPLSIARPLQAL